MKIKSIRSLGFRQTYSPEMKSDNHNYITNSSSAVHRNSHAAQYCLVAYRCLWLKAHFAPEYWAAVLSRCHPKKLDRYIGTARGEGWMPTDITMLGHIKESKTIKFGTLNINNLTTKFTVTGNTINQGLIGVSGIGAKAAAIFESKGSYKNIDEFLSVPERRKKTIIERLIKLGAFAHLPGHENSKALWNYYLYRYGGSSNKEIVELRKNIKNRLLAVHKWNPASIKAAINEQIEAYFAAYPKRNKIPPKIKNWKPPLADTFENIIDLFKDDHFTLEEILEFQRQYVRYYINSPLDLFQCDRKLTIANAKQQHSELLRKGTDPKYALVQVIGMVKEFSTAFTKATDDRESSEYGRLIITDGIDTTLVLLWSKELTTTKARYGENVFTPGTGLYMCVRYDDTRNSFSVISEPSYFYENNKRRKLREDEWFIQKLKPIIEQ